MDNHAKMRGTGRRVHAAFYAREPDASPGRQPTHLPTPLPPASFPIPRLSAPTPLSEGAPANGQSC